MATKADIISVFPHLLAALATGRVETLYFGIPHKGKTALLASAMQTD
jgi:hypothetical protein